MADIILAIIVVLILVILALLIWLMIILLKTREQAVAQQATISAVQQQLEAFRTAQQSSAENLNKSMQTSQQTLTQSLSSSQKILSQLNSQVGELHGTNKQMLQMGTDVKRLQQILSSPKLRGNMGEWSLENVLANILPAESYRLQHTMKDGKRVDALIVLADYSVPIDAKFPLPSFEAMTAAETDEEKNKLRKAFLNDCTKHIDKIAADYIRPAEGTLDFAMMYIPAENIYYETVIKYDTDTKDILNYALDKKVIPISPNLLYAYLMTVVMGLHGLRIEKQASEIRQNLKKLTGSYEAFASCWDTLGKHIRNASAQYDQGDQKLNKFEVQLTQIHSDTEENQTDAP